MKGIENIIDWSKGVGVLLIILLGYSCANITGLTGGEKDTTAPGIDATKSDANNITNFKKRSFELYFDEWVTLKDKSQIIVSPPLKYNPVITHKGKRVRFEFNEKDTLKEQTTYVIQFGKSIVDFTEGNPLDDYKYIFSTGDVIDSLTLEGMVKDAYTNSPMGDVTVMLYKDLADSVVYNDRPFYIATSKENGRFRFTNLGSGEYKILALKDENLDYKFSPGDEMIGFVDSLVAVDTSTLDIEIKLFLETQTLKFMERKQPNRYTIDLLFNQSPKEIDFSFSKKMEYQSVVDGDSLLIWHQYDSIKNARLYVLGDTLKLKRIKDTLPTIALKKKSVELSIHPTHPYHLKFSQPISSIATSLITLTDTSKQNMEYQLKIDSLDRRGIAIVSDWKEDQRYQLMILPGAVKSYFETTTDSIELSIKTRPLGDYGTILVKIEQLDSLYEHTVLLKQNDKILNQLQIPAGNNRYEHTFIDKLEGTYDIEIIEDKDKNHKWSPGSYLNKKHSEYTMQKSLGALRQNWDLEVAIDYRLLDNVADSTAVDMNLMEGEKEIKNIEKGDQKK